MKFMITDSSIRILKNASCPTLSDKGKLGYHIGINANDELLIRVASNSGSGYFSSEWVPVNTTLNLLEISDKPLTSYSLLTLYKGKSVNTPAFLFAALKGEGLVVTDAENPRCYALMPTDAFMAQMTTLKASDINLEVAEPKVKLAKPTNQKIIFTGYIPHEKLKYLYSAADIIVLPSIWQDPCPLVVLEAMASGTCLVSSAVGGVPEVVDNGINALLVEAENVEALIQAICNILANPYAMNMMELAAREKIITKYSWERLVGELEVML